jgi:glycosyltransferase involved in cell wall biosynthesis
MAANYSPLVSVIIPTYNRGNLLVDAVESVIAQTYNKYEIIVVDDGSTDNTSDLIKRYTDTGKIKYVPRPSDLVRGANSCRNFGLLLSKGELIKWLDSDDVLDHQCLDKQVERMSNTDLDVCFCQADYFRQSGPSRELIPSRVWGRLQPADREKTVEEYLLTNLRWQTACGLWRRGFLPPKPFLEGLNNSQEWLMHLLMIIQKPSADFLNENLVHVRVHQDSMSNAAKKRGDYYYHQCISRIQALRSLRANNYLSLPLFKKLIRFILWNQLFIVYKGAPMKGVGFLRYYPELFWDFIRSIKPSQERP